LAAESHARNGSTENSEEPHRTAQLPARGRLRALGLQGTRVVAERRIHPAGNPESQPSGKAIRPSVRIVSGCLQTACMGLYKID